MSGGFAEAETLLPRLTSAPGKEGVSREGTGVSALLGRDSGLLVTLTVTLAVTNLSELNSQSPAGCPDAEKHGQLCGLGKGPGAHGSDRVSPCVRPACAAHHPPALDSARVSSSPA